MKMNQLLCAALTVGAGLAAFAGTTETVTFTATVPSVLELSTNNSSTTVSLVAADFTGSDSITKEVANAQQLQVRSNRAWVLSAKSGTATFSFTPSVAGDTRSKPASDLSVRKSGGTYQPLSTTDVQVATGSAGGASASGNTFGVDYKLASDISTDRPGSYVLNVVYTLTAP